MMTIKKSKGEMEADRSNTQLLSHDLRWLLQILSSYPLCPFHLSYFSEVCTFHLFSFQSCDLQSCGLQLGGQVTKLKLRVSTIEGRSIEKILGYQFLVHCYRARVLLICWSVKNPGCGATASKQAWCQQTN